jgi:hypothetical protein
MTTCMTRRILETLTFGMATEVLTTENIKTTVSRDVTPCSLVSTGKVKFVLCLIKLNEVKR